MSSPQTPALDTLALDTLARQTLMLGFRGLSVDDDATIRREIRAGAGCVVYFDVDGPSGGELPRNVESPDQVRALSAALASEAPGAPLLVSIDMEGGLVCRLKERYGFPATVSAQQLGEGEPEQTYEAALALAGTLADVGVNFNLAPCVDVNVNPDNPIIGGKKRSYSADPEKVADHAAAFMRAHHDRGVLTCLKHFPGHGSSRTDTHVGFTDVTDTWSRDELIPFRRLIEAGLVDAIMTAHVVNRELDDVPATLSESILEGLLRSELGYEGVIVSDDMAMGAIAKEYGFEEALVGTLAAGVDMVALANQGVEYEDDIGERAVSILVEAVTAGRLPRARLESAAQRVMALRQRLTGEE